MNAFVSLKTADAAVGGKARELHAIWHILTDGRIAPCRADIKLRHVRSLTQWLWRVDVVDAGRDFQFRLIGDRVAQFYGHNFSGVFLSAFPQDPFTQLMWRTLGACVSHKKPYLIGPQLSMYPGKDFMEIEALFLPLSEDGENVTSIIGTMEYWPAGTYTAMPQP